MLKRSLDFRFLFSRLLVPRHLIVVCVIIIGATILFSLTSGSNARLLSANSPTTLNVTPFFTGTGVASNIYFDTMVVDASGRVILHGACNTLPSCSSVFSISPTGTLNWRSADVGSSAGTKQILTDLNNQIYYSGLGAVYSFDANGQTVNGWPISIPGLGSVIQDPLDGTIFARGENGITTFSIYAIQPNGVQKWRRDYPGPESGRTLVQTFNGAVATVAANTKGLFMLDRMTGQEVCSNINGGGYYYSLVGAADGLFTPFHSKVTSYDATCGMSEIFQETKDLELRAYDGANIYGLDYPVNPFDPNQMHPIAISQNGSFLWRQTNIKIDTSGILSVKNGILYVIGRDVTDSDKTKLFLLNKDTGTIADRLDLAPYCTACGFAVTADGTMFLNDQQNRNIFKVERVGNPTPTPTPTPIPSCTNTSGMVAWWKGENNTVDSIGLNNGTLLNGATFTAGRVGQAFSFDGMDDHIKVSSSPLLNSQSGLTLEAWIFPTSFAGYNTIISKWDSIDGLNQRSYALDIESGGIVYFKVNRDGSHDNFQQVASSAGVPLNTWSHVAGVYDGSNLKIFINGQLSAQLPYSNGIFAGNADVSIGALASGGPAGQSISNFTGAIDELSVYNHGLAASEVQAIFSAGAAGKCGGLPPTGVAFDDTILVDRFPNIPLEARTPVIMIHGIHGNRVGNNDTMAVTNKLNFKNLYTKLNDTAEYNADYKTYLFQYVSDRYTLSEIGKALRDHLDRMPGFADRQVILVTHSMGGLVARHFMYQTVYSGTQYLGQPSGARVLRMITLATPHHGTYAANMQLRAPDDFGNRVTRASFRYLLKKADAAYWGVVGCAACATDIRPNRSSLLWDNFDNRFSYAAGSNEIRTEVLDFEPYTTKIIAYRGTIAADDPARQVLGNVEDLAFALYYGDEHIGLVATSLILNSIEAKGLDFSAPRSDGFVPPSSAGFQSGNINGQPIDCPNSDHKQMRDGNSSTKCSDNKYLLNSVRDKIVGRNLINREFISGPDRTDFGRHSTSNIARMESTASVSGTREVLLTNSGDVASVVTSISLSGPSANQFSLVQPPQTPFSVAPRSSLKLKVAFNPTSVGDKTAELDVVNDSANSPVLIPLSGTGFPPECDLTLSPSSGFVGVAGGTSVINVGNIPCQMSVSASEAWLHPIVVGDHVEFITDPNTGTVQRDGVVFISLDGGPTLPFGVSQSPANQPCGLNFSAEQALIPTDGGNSGFEVTTSTNCSWTYQSDSAWLTLGTSGVLTGPQQVTFNAPAAMSSRTANITVSDGTMTGEFTITQPGPANISGRVLNKDGRGVTNATVTAVTNNGSPVTFRTNRFGYYHFDNLPAGVVYTVSVSSRRYSFDSRFVQLVDALSDVDFTANP